MDSLGTQRIGIRGPRLLALALASALTIGLTACGGGEELAGPDDGGNDEWPVLDFSAIAGAWSGPALEGDGIDFWIEARFDASARRHLKVGEVAYSLDEGGEVNCIGDWLANSVEGDTYVVKEEITSGSCPDGTVTLEHDPEAETLEYHFLPDNGDPDLEGEGTLTR